MNSGHDGVEAFAESACIQAAESRFDVSGTRAYRFDQNSSGYIVRLSATLDKGGPAKITCLTNKQGGVREVRISEQQS